MLVLLTNRSGVNSRRTEMYAIAAAAVSAGVPSAPSAAGARNTLAVKSDTPAMSPRKYDRRSTRRTAASRSASRLIRLVVAVARNEKISIGKSRITLQGDRAA